MLVAVILSSLFTSVCTAFHFQGKPRNEGRL